VSVCYFPTILYPCISNDNARLRVQRWQQLNRLTRIAYSCKRVWKLNISSETVAEQQAGTVCSHFRKCIRQNFTCGHTAIYNMLGSIPN
jgi:hypothetical protein